MILSRYVTMGEKINKPKINKSNSGLRGKASDWWAFALRTPRTPLPPSAPPPPHTHTHTPPLKCSYLHFEGQEPKSDGGQPKFQSGVPDNLSSLKSPLGRVYMCLVKDSIRSKLQTDSILIDWRTSLTIKCDPDDLHEFKILVVRVCIQYKIKEGIWHCFYFSMAIVIRTKHYQRHIFLIKIRNS